MEPKIFSDERGYFFESFRDETLISSGVKIDFVQDNESCSSKNVLRGLHFQRPPREQAKLVRAVNGSILDVVVDIRKNSPAFGKHFSVILSARNHKMLYIPAGFAHGFLSLEDNSVVTYKCSGYYNKESEVTLLWNDDGLNIEWGITEPLVSVKDRQGISFRNFNSPFLMPSND